MGTTRDLVYGSQGEDVKILQQLLNKANPMLNLKVDGIYGTATQTAVRNWQSQNGLKVDGIAGKNTMASLNPTTNSTNNSGTDFDYKSFDFDAYEESDSVKKANSALQSHLVNQPGAYNSQWQAQLDEIYNKIMNREDFSYDFNTDALYHQYKDNFTKQGKMAMQDTMGQAAAMTGGYGNSYAQTVGQQTYNAHLEQLNDVIPELYQMAYDRYNQDGQDLYNQYAMVSDRENTDYGRYRDSVTDWQTERDYLAGRYDSEREYDHGKYTADRDFAYDQYSDDKTYAYQSHADKIEQERWEKEFALAQDKFDWEKSQASASSSGSGGSGSGSGGSGGNGGGNSGGGSYDNGGLTKAQIKQLQDALGVTADGMYGEASKKAAGGLSAQEAYKKYVGGGVVADPNSTAVANFKSSISPESSHDAIARQMYGPYTAYVAVQLAKNTSLSDAEKLYLITYYGITDSDLQYARDKGYDI